MLPSRTSARLSQFRLAMDKVFVASIRSVFVSAPKVSLVFSNCYFTFEISSALGRYRLQKLYRIFMAVVAVAVAVARCVAFIYLRQGRHPQEKQETETVTETETETKTEST